MTLYVITEGCYSDYHIVCIFTDKEKAENYAKYNTGFDTLNIEEYETEDDKYTVVTDGYKTVAGCIGINDKCRLGDVIVHNSELTADRRDKVSLTSYPYKNEWELFIVRSYPEKAFRYQEEEKVILTQILSDTAGMIANLKGQGYTVDQVREMMNIPHEQ